MTYFIGDSERGKGIYKSENAFDAAGAGIGSTFLYLSPLTPENTLETESGGRQWYYINSKLGGSPMKYYVLASDLSEAITNFAKAFPSAEINQVSFFSDNLG